MAWTRSQQLGNWDHWLLGQANRFGVVHTRITKRTEAHLSSGQNQRSILRDHH